MRLVVAPRVALALAVACGAAGCDETGTEVRPGGVDAGITVDATVEASTDLDAAVGRIDAAADSEQPDSGPGLDGARAGEASSDARAPTAAAACAHYYAASYTLCGGPGLPASDASRFQARFEQVCLNDVALPGSGMTPAAVEACASALDAWPCVNQGPPEACYFFGALSGGAACNEGLQCQSGQCQGTVAFSPGGQIGPFTCGTCVPVVALGQACGSAGCPAGAICMTSDPSAKQPTYTCTVVTQGGAGASCNGVSAVCGPGLYCSTQGKCAGLEDAGASCSLDPSTCAPPLNCVGPSGTASCALLGDGGVCHFDFDCVSGLGCVPGPCVQGGGIGGCSAAGTCRSVAWVDAGETCNGFGTRCLVGSCQCSPGSTSCGLGMPLPVDGGLGEGTCPALVPDGQPCSSGGLFGSGPTCDNFAECFTPLGPAGMTGAMGTCTLVDSAVCK